MTALQSIGFTPPLPPKTLPSCSPQLVQTESALFCGKVSIPTETEHIALTTTEIID